MNWQVHTNHPVAVDSLDHLHPLGTAHDNSTNIEFSKRLMAILPDNPTVLDIGCAGGGFVKEMVDLGADAIGIEGSDYSKAMARAEWGMIPERLFTADMTKELFIVDRDKRRGSGSLKIDTLHQFDCITAWEFWEHIPEDGIFIALRNLTDHLKTGGLHICSISYHPSPHEGVDLHRTQRGPYYWLEKFRGMGLRPDWEIKNYFDGNWVRKSDINLVLRFMERPTL